MFKTIIAGVAAVLLSLAPLSASLADDVTEPPSASVAPSEAPEASEPPVDPSAPPTEAEEPDVEPSTEPSTEPVTEPVTEPSTEPSTEPVTEPVITPSPSATPPPPTVQPCVTYSSVHSDTLASWAFGESSTDGSAHWALTDNGLWIKTDDTGHRKVAGYYAVDFPLTEIGNGVRITYDGTPEPGGQARVDYDGDGAWDFTLVDESLYGGVIWASIPGGGTWVSQSWAPHASGGGGYPNQGTYDEWLAALSADGKGYDVTQIGFSLGSGLTSEGTITKIKAGCTKYTFGNTVPEDSVSYGQWTYEVDCDNEVGDVVPATREVTETTYSRDEHGEIVVASSTRPEPGEHTVTEEDIDALECPVTPTPTPTPTDTTPPTTPPPTPPTDDASGDSSSLALTGGNGLAAFLSALAAAGLIGTGGLLLHRRRVTL